MKLFDLHCDTALELWLQKQPLCDNSLHVSLKKTAPYEAYVQIAAVWSDRRLDDEAAWRQYLAVSDAFAAEIARTPGARLAADAASIAAGAAAGERVFVPAVEDARLLGGDLSRLETLSARGVRILTLLWGGESRIGGAHDTAAPLTPFGREVVRRCFSLGITPDVSHASRAAADEILSLAEAAGRPAVASHSNSYAVFPHPRNLTDAEFARIAALGGVVGISLAPMHLTDGPCTADTVAEHVLHDLSLGGEDVLCLGCDFDGIPAAPEGLGDVSRLGALADALASRGVPPRVVDKIFFENAFRFAQRNFV